ncbi:hypothetical protein DDT91_14220 [Algoriphagus sp. AK58]|nr:hypothetical protein [Algoriphagus sp. AK58]
MIWFEKNPWVSDSSIFLNTMFDSKQGLFQYLFLGNFLTVDLINDAVYILGVISPKSIHFAFHLL